MPQYSRFFGGPAGLEPEYTQSNFSDVLRRFLTNGVIPGVTNELAVAEASPPGMKVAMNTGEAWILGFWYQNDALLELDIAAADPIDPRIDRIVLQLDTVTDLEIKAVVLTGTPAPSPSPPALTRNNDVHEISLAQLAVGAGVTSIVNADITDERGDDELCGMAVAPNILEIAAAIVHGNESHSPAMLEAVVDDTTPVLGGDLDGAGKTASDIGITNYFEPVVVVADSGAAYTIDLAVKNVFKIRLTDNCTFTFSNPPASGKAGSFTLILIQDDVGGRGVNWPVTVLWAGGGSPVLSTDADKIDILTFFTVDGGTTWYGSLVGVDFS